MLEESTDVGNRIPQGVLRRTHKWPLCAGSTHRITAGQIMGNWQLGKFSVTHFILWEDKCQSACWRGEIGQNLMSL